MLGIREFSSLVFESPAFFRKTTLASSFYRRKHLVISIWKASLNCAISIHMNSCFWSFVRHASVWITHHSVSTRAGTISGCEATIHPTPALDPTRKRNTSSEESKTFQITPFFPFFFSPGMGRLEKCNWIIFVLFSIDPFLFLDERHRNPSHYESNIHAECGFKCHLQRNVRHIDLITRRVRRIGFVYLLIFSWTWGLFLRLGSSSPWNISICAFIALFYETRKTWYDLEFVTFDFMGTWRL